MVRIVVFRGEENPDYAVQNERLRHYGNMNGYEVIVFPETGYDVPAAQNELSEAAAVVLGPGLPDGLLAFLPYIRETCMVVRYCEMEPEKRTWIGSHRVIDLSLRDLEAEGRAELTLTLILALKRKLIRHNQQLLEGKWIAHMASETAGTTVGIVGGGPEGRILTGYLEGMGCRVIRCEGNITQENGGCSGGAPKTIEEIFAEADIVTIHRNCISSEEYVVDSKLLALMKPHAILVDTGCPLTVDLEALYTVLKERQIEAAALDCFDRETVTPDSSLLELHNLIVTPHISGKTRETLWKVDRHMIDVLKRELDEQLDGQGI